MAAVGAAFTMSWLLPSGLGGLFILLLLISILAALCTDCNRRSFELEERLADKNPPALIRVVKLEEVRENPMIDDIQKDEEDFHQKKTSAPVRSLQSQQGEPKTPAEPLPEEDTAASFTPWRSHLMAPPSQGSADLSPAYLNGSSPPDSTHLYNTISGRRDDGTPSPPANHDPATQPHEEHVGRSVAKIILSDHDRNSLYARISKKVSLTSSPARTPEEWPQVEEEESSPPLPNRSADMDG